MITRSTTPRLRLVTDATSEPVSLSDAKAFCRVDIPDDDALITSLITAARRYVEKQTGLALKTQTWAAVLDNWPEGVRQGLGGPWWDGVRDAPLSLVTPTTVIEIGKRPFQAVTNVKLRDAYGTLTTVDSSIYWTEISDMRGRINRKLGQIWPVVIYAGSGAIEVTFTAGFDASPYEGVPDDLVTAIKVMVKHWYDFREPITEGSVAKVPMHVGDILKNWMPMRLR